MAEVQVRLLVRDKTLAVTVLCHACSETLEKNLHGEKKDLTIIEGMISCVIYLLNGPTALTKQKH